MKKSDLFLSVFAFCAAVILSGCGSKSVDPSVSDLVKRVWTASIVKWDGGVKYDKTKSTNEKQGYAQYKLDLSAPPAASLTDFDGRKFTGTYAVSTDGSVLTLSALTSTDGAPTGTGGTLKFNILTKPTEKTLSLRTDGPYIKASNTTVELLLVNP